MNRFKFILFFCSVFIARDSLGQHPYLEEVFTIIEQHSINRDSLDFKQIKKEAYMKLGEASLINDCYPIVRFVLSQLNDHHSFFMPKDQVNSWKSNPIDKERLPFSGKMVSTDIGYIEMLGFGSGDSVAMTEYATRLQQLIKSIDHKNLKGWIVDLRQNGGGNCYPMLAGIGPLLGEGISGYFVDVEKKKTGWYYRKGKSGVGATVYTGVSIPYTLFNEALPIAVLTGPRTGSSGEVMVTSFRGKANTKSFGEPTAGLSTGNQDFTLSDGSMIFLTTSVYADRLGNTYGGKISPDVLQSFAYGGINQEDDPVIARAVSWIRELK